MPWLVEQIPSPISGYPRYRYFQCWSSFRRGVACWYDKKRAKRMTRAEVE